MAYYARESSISIGGTDYSVNFPYLDKSHVKVKVDGVITAYTWVNATTIRISPAPAAGAVVQRYRQTSPNDRLVDWQSPTALTEEDLDLDSLQMLYLMQEGLDTADDTIQLDSLGRWDAETHRIINVTDPTSAQDAATKNFVETAMTSQVNQAAASAAAAQTARTGAETARTGAETARAAAETAETNAETAETNAETAQAAAASSAAAAASSATTATTKASEADTSALTALVHANNAYNASLTANSAKLAAESARDSALSALDEFTDKYLGSKAADPSFDNDGNALVEGAVYWNSTSKTFRAYNGTAWVDAIPNGVVAIPQGGTGANNASDAVKNLISGTTGVGDPLSSYIIPVHDDVNNVGRKLYLVNALKATGLLTEETAPEFTADYVLLYDSSTGLAKKLKLATFLTKVVGVRGAARNLQGSTSGATGMAITADELILTDDNGNTFVARNVNVQAHHTNPNGDGGRDAGSEAASTWYYLWVIAKPDGTIGRIMSASPTTPTMPSGFTYKAMVSAAYNDASSNLRGYFQRGNDVFYQASVANLSGGTAQSVTAVGMAATVPPVALTSKIEVRGDSSATSVAWFQILISGGVYFNGVLPANSSSYTDTDFDCTVLDIPNVSQTLYYQMQPGVGGVSLQIWVMGYKLPVGGE